MKTWQRLKTDPALWNHYFIREKALRAIRGFFSANNFHEVETPLLIAYPPAESYLEIFETTLLDRQRRPTKAYLATSPEVALKKLMVAGLGDCYSLTKSFRNMETQSTLHNPEFTILEWYRVGAEYTQIMDDCETLFLSINRSLGHENILTYQGKQVNLSPPWERVTVAHAFGEYVHASLEAFFDMNTARQICTQKGYTFTQNTTWEELYNQIFLNEVEPHLGHGHPTILYEFPASLAALAKLKDTDPRYAQRFEFYIEGLELGDCYSELTDADEQEARFQKELEEVQRLGRTLYEYDHDFIAALKVGLPTCSGIAVGVDRLVMLFADVADIADTLFFPAKEEFALSKG